MIIRSLILSTSLIAAIATTAVAETTITIREPEVRTIVTEAGYSDPILVQRNGTLWRVKSLDADDNTEVTLFVNERGEILGAADVAEARLSRKITITTEKKVETPVTQETVALVAMNAGFPNVHDIDYLDSRGVWKLEADDISGEDYELHISPNIERAGITRPL